MQSLEESLKRVTGVNLLGRVFRHKSVLICLCQAMSILWMVFFLEFPATAAPRSSTPTAEVSFRSVAGAESVASITASAPGTAWSQPGAEAAIATIYIDGRYNQDIVVDHGPKAWTYRVFLGPLGAGAHSLAIERNARWSAPHAPLRVQTVTVHSVSPSNPEYTALAHAPILYARADTLGHFSDVPLLAWYEVFAKATGEEIQYSFVFSNEDSGTPTAALMARWGRTTDIEYAYRVWLNRTGQIQRETFQGFNHKDVPFRGKKDGEHPYILVATPNNVFADTGASELQYHLLPVRADLSHHSREELMDRFPWTYKIMSEELKRENKLRPFGGWSLSAVSDPRNYLYLELDSHNENSGLMVWVKIKGNPRLYSSNHGFPRLAIWRSGWFRTTVELPPGTKDGSIQDVGLECIAPRINGGHGSEVAQCLVHAVSKVFLLDPAYRPGKNILTMHSDLKLEPGEIYMLTPKNESASISPQ